MMQNQVPGFPVRAFRIVAPICICVILTQLCACEERDIDDRADIVMVTIDTLRADHLGCYGYPRNISPFVDWMAEQGVLFENAIAPSATTAPSHASMFTGLYPLQHGVRMNGHRLDNTVPTLAEFLGANGYETAAFVSTRAHFGPGGLDRGFTFFQDPERGVNNASKTVQAAKVWLNEWSGRKPLFLWVHLYDPHTPYESEHALPAATPEEADEHVRFLLEELRVDYGFFDSNRELLLLVNDAYDREVLAADRSIRDLYEYVAQRAFAEETLWIVASDHGEGLGSHNWLGHSKHIYNEQIRVPLIVHSSSGSLSAKRISGIVELVDLMPTIAELAAAEPLPEDRRRPGRSLVSLLKGNGITGEERFAFSQRREFAPDTEEQIAEMVEKRMKGQNSALDAMIRDMLLNCFESGDKYSLQNSRFKYILRSDFADEFYDLRSDPYETSNLIGTGLEEEELMRASLEAIVATYKQQSSGSALDVDDEAMERLKALGYVK
jgi:arylsulfatase A-like enzyme